MQRASDALCREYGLSVIENPQRGKSKHYGEWRAQQEGRPTYLSLIKADVDAAICQSMTERQFFYHLRQMGYEIKMGKDITLRAPGRENGRKLMRNFGEEYSLENIRKRILSQRSPQREYSPKPKRYRLKGDLKKARRATGFRALYYHYCYLLGVFPKKRQAKWVPHQYREDLIRAKELSDEAKLLGAYQIDTAEQLISHQTDVEEKLVANIEHRQQLYRKQRTKAVLADPETLEQVKSEIAALTGDIKKLRREVKLCKDIAVRSSVIQEKIQAAAKDLKGKELERNEPLRRRGRAGREDEL